MKPFTFLLFFAGFFQIADAMQATSMSMLRSLNDVLWPSVISFVAFVNFENVFEGNFGHGNVRIGG